MTEYNNPNEKAYNLLEAAKTTSSKIKYKDENGQERELDDLYPLTMEEAKEMKSLLQQAKEAIKDPTDSTINEHISYVQGIVNWSMEKHYNISRLLLSVLVLFIVTSLAFLISSISQTRKTNANIALVNNWSDISESLEGENIYKNYSIYRANVIYDIEQSIKETEKSISKYNDDYSYGPTEGKEKALKQKGNAEARLEKQKQYLEQLENKDFSYYQEHALNRLNKSKGFQLLGFSEIELVSFFFLLICIALSLPYILSCHQYGYVIKRNSLINTITTKITNGISHLLFSIAGFRKKEAETTRTVIYTANSEQAAGFALMNLLWPILRISFAISIYCYLIPVLMILTIVQTITNTYHNIKWK